MKLFSTQCLCGGCALCLAAQGCGPRDGNADIESCDESDAEDELGRDARAIADFLDGAIGEPEVVPFQPSTPACWIEFDRCETGLLLVLAFDAGQPSDTRIGAMDALRERFVHEMADGIRELAQRIANDRRDEQCDFLAA
jgi:hypothetical protein